MHEHAIGPRRWPLRRGKLVTEMPPEILILVCVVAGVLGGLAAAVVYHKRQLASMRALLTRLEELTKIASGKGPDEEATVKASPGQASGEAASLSVITADVLAGRTKHVNDILKAGNVKGLSLADQAIFQIYAHIEDTLSPSELAKSLNVSLRSLERGLSLSLECTPRQLILAVKMREARRILEAGELNVTGVAYRLGFSSPSHFSRRFQQFFRKSPSAVARRVA